MSRIRLIVALLCVYVLARSWGGGSVLPEIIAPTAPDRAVYVYDKNQTRVPPAVLAAIDKLNRSGTVTADKYETGTLDGDGQVPDQYVVPLAAAEEAGLPALVIMGGGEVIRVMPGPTEDAPILEALL